MPASANPYIAGSPVTGEEMFFGREDVFAFIKQALTGQHRDHVLVLYGQRRTGKTSVLYQLHRHLGPRYLCIFIDLHGLALTSVNGFIWELANHISRSLKRDYGIQVPRPERDDFMADPRRVFEGDFLESVWAAIGDRHILLMLDEAVRLEEQVKAGVLEPEIFEYLRHLMQHYPQLNFLFSLGSGLEEMEKEYALLFNVALYKKISFLDRQSVVDLITRPVEGMIQFDPGAVERIVQITSAHPYFTQLLCHSLFNFCQNRSSATVEIRDVDAVLDEAVERGLAVLKYVWEESTPVEKAVLAGMAAAVRGKGRPASADQLRKIWERQGVSIPAGEIAQAIKSLIARDVIAGEDRYDFTVELQRLWVQKYRRLEWVREEIEPAAQGWVESKAAPKPVLKRPWWRRKGFVLPLLGFLIVFIPFIYFVFQYIANNVDFSPVVATEPVAVTVEPGGGVVPGGGATLVNDLEALGNYVWAATDGGLVRWRIFEWSQPGGVLLIHGDQVGLPDDCINAITADPSGDLWLGCGGVARVRPQGGRIVTLDYFSRDNGLDMGVIRALTVDDQGWIWAGGVSSAPENVPLNYFDGESHPDGFAWRSDDALNQALVDMGIALDVRSLASSQDGSLWIGLADGTILRWDGVVLDRFLLEGPDGSSDPDLDPRVRTLLQDREGRLWAAATEKGLFRFDEVDGSWSQVDTLPIDSIGGRARSAALFSDGGLWVGGDQAVAVSRDGGVSWNLTGGSLGDRIAGIVEDARGQAWVGTYGEGVSVFQGDSWHALQR